MSERYLSEIKRIRKKEQDELNVAMPEPKEILYTAMEKSNRSITSLERSSSLDCLTDASTKTSDLLLVGSSEEKDLRNIEAMGKRMVLIDKEDIHLISKRKNIPIGVRRKGKIGLPRYILEARSPGSIPRVLLRKIDVARRARERPAVSPFEPEKIRNRSAILRRLNERTTGLQHPIEIGDLEAMTQASLTSFSAENIHCDQGILVNSAELISAESVKDRVQLAEPKDAEESAKGYVESVEPEDAEESAKGHVESVEPEDVEHLVEQLTHIPEEITELILEPTEALLNATGGQSNHILINESNLRYAVKMKPTSNLIQVTPKYAFLDPGTICEIEVVRIPGDISEPNKIIIYYLAVDQFETDPTKHFTLKNEFKYLIIDIVNV